MLNMEGFDLERASDEELKKSPYAVYRKKSEEPKQPEIYSAHKIKSVVKKLDQIKGSPQSE